MVEDVEATAEDVEAMVVEEEDTCGDTFQEVAEEAATVDVEEEDAAVAAAEVATNAVRWRR
jgi:hypothetical protein